MWIRVYEENSNNNGGGYWLSLVCVGFCLEYFLCYNFVRFRLEGFSLGKE